MIDTKHWKDFNLNKLFFITAGKYYSSDEYVKGNTPYISASATHNGIAQRIDLPPDFEGNLLITGKIGSICFYQTEPFCATSDVNVFKAKNFKMNKKLGLYLASIINFSENYKWSYGRQCRVGDSKKINIKLPVLSDKNGQCIIDPKKTFSDEGYIPDWEYMEKFIERLETRERESQGSIRNALKTENKIEKVPELNINNWKEFLLEDIFEEIYKSEAYVKNDLTTFDSNKIDRISFVSRTDKNNGCDCYVPLVDISVKEKGNAIIIGDTTSTIYYQENDFITGDHIVVCRAKWINKYTALFIKSLIEKERYKYSYGRAFKMDLIKKTKINLPTINANGEFVPDWDFMENYIKSLPYGDKI